MLKVTDTDEGKRVRCGSSRVECLYERGYLRLRPEPPPHTHTHIQYRHPYPHSSKAFYSSSSLVTFSVIAIRWHPLNSGIEICHLMRPEHPLKLDCHLPTWALDIKVVMGMLQWGITDFMFWVFENKLCKLLQGLFTPN